MRLYTATYETGVPGATRTDAQLLMPRVVAHTVFMLPSIRLVAAYAVEKVELRAAPVLGTSQFMLARGGAGGCAM